MMTRNAEKVLRQSVTEAWVSGIRPTQANLAELVRARGEAMTQRQVGIWFTKWSEAGIAVAQRGTNGKPGSAYVFNWGERSVDDLTLREIVSPALVDEVEVNGRIEPRQRQDEQARKLRGALRVFFGVTESRSDAELLKACEKVTAKQLHDLPERVHERALQVVSKRAAANYRARVRSAMRDAAKNDFPVVFAKVWEDDAWDEARDRYFGAAVGALDNRQRQLRCHWNHLADAARALSPAVAEPGELTLDHVEEICDSWKASAKAYLVNQVKTMLRAVARDFGEGPYVVAVETTGTRSMTRNGWRNPGRLLSNAGEANTGDWSGFIELVREAGYGADWIEFLRWYGEFITLDSHTIERRDDEFPIRPPRWRLAKTSLAKRIINLRTILGLAPGILNRGPSDLTPYDVFGVRHRPVIPALCDWWAERAKNPLDTVSSAHSDGLEKLVLTFGLMAYPLYLKSQHERGSAPASADDHRMFAQDGAQKTVAEMRLFAAYRASRTKAKEIQKNRQSDNSAAGDNTVKDILRIVENTPAKYWIALLDEMIREVRAKTIFDEDGVAIGVTAEVSERAYHCLVADTYYHGWLVSTGMRISETAHVRIDTQYTDELRGREMRECRLRAEDRKETPHTMPHDCAVHERFVPRWLEDLYLGRSRPFFMVEWPSRERVTDAGRVTKARGKIQEHAWLFVDRRGRAIGCVEEDRHGKGRDPLSLNSRLSHLRKRWQARCAAAAVRLRMKVSTYDREFSNHVVRNAMGFAIYQEIGLQHAANFLGDKEESIQNVYTAVAGRLVDTSRISGAAGGSTRSPNNLPAEFKAEVSTVGRKADAVRSLEASATATRGPTRGDSPRAAVLRRRIEQLTDQLLAGEVSEEEWSSLVGKLERVHAA